MGYFSNGTEGEIYEEDYCSRCVHQNGPDGESGCAVWAAHMLHNYEACNDETSILHLLIPIKKDGLGNEQCLMFCEGEAIFSNTEELERAADYLKRGDKNEALLHIGRALGGEFYEAFS